MTTPETLQSLLLRCEAAEGADREIDGELYCLSDPVIAQCWPYWGRDQREALTPHYTVSLDESLALCANVLPGWTMACDATAPECGIDWDLFAPGPGGASFTGTHDKHALALICAMLRALISQADVGS